MKSGRVIKYGIKNVVVMAIVMNLIIVEAVISSRQGCSNGDNDFCERYDYEGACCANIRVAQVNTASTLSETVGQ